MWSSLSEDEFRSKMRGFMDDVLEEWGVKDEEAFLGTEAILEQDVYVRRVPKAGKRSVCRSGCIQLWKAFRDQYRRFVFEYRDAFFALKMALKAERGLELVRFPKGGIVPGCLVPT